jgi:DNA adenine methylase
LPTETLPRITPPLRYHGAKHYLAAWLQGIAEGAKPYTTRVHLFGGAYNDAWNWEEDGVAEVYNDINADLTNLFLTLKDQIAFENFRRAVADQPLSPLAFDLAKRVPLRPSQDGRVTVDVPRAAAFFVRVRMSRQGLRKDYVTPTTRTRRRRNEQVSAWRTAVDGLDDVHRRLVDRVEVLARVDADGVVRGYDFADAIARYDSDSTLFVADPTYLPETRVTTADYEDEMLEADHVRLLTAFATCEGKFLLSGYANALYREYEGRLGWNRHVREVPAASSGKKAKEKRTEVCWTNF